MSSCWRSSSPGAGVRSSATPPVSPTGTIKVSETVEVSIALAAGSRGQGIGTALYRALLECLADEPVHVALAGIVLPNDALIALQRKLGFTEVGIFHEYAVKNGQYLSSIWMERRFPGH
jgi:phosphinothricin acetyltransferase